MDSNSHTPLGDTTNTVKEADAKERKKEKDRARWREQKDAINKRRREAYHQRKNQHVIGTTSYNDTSSNKENAEPDETDDWLHRNDSYHTSNIVDDNDNMATHEPCNYIC